MTFSEWSSKAVEFRILEAAETDLAMPKPRGPKMFGSAMPEPVQEPQESYGYQQTRVRRVPSPGSLDRYSATLTWVNDFIAAPADRRFLWFWAIAKVNPNRSVGRFAHENSMNSRTLRRQITKLCGIISSNLNRLHVSRLSAAIDPMSEIGAEADPEAISSVTYANHWHSPDIKPPRHLHELYVQTAPGKRRAG